MFDRTTVKNARETNARCHETHEDTGLSGAGGGSGLEA